MFGDELEGKLAITGYVKGQGTDYITMNGKVYVREYGSSEENVSWNPALVFLQTRQIIPWQITRLTRQIIHSTPLRYSMII